MKQSFGTLATGEQAFLYTISCGELIATVTDYGAHLVSLLVPDRKGKKADVVLGFDDAEGYRTGNGGFLGAIVGRNANGQLMVCHCSGGGVVVTTAGQFNYVRRTNMAWNSSS